MKVLTDAQIERLKLFNIAVDAILASRFVEEMASKKRQITIKFDNIDPATGATNMSHKRTGYDQEFTNNVLTKVRLFTHDATDNISIRKMEELYHSMPINQKYKDRITEIRRLVNNNLDRQAFLIGGNLTSRQIYDTLTYGMFLHLNEDKVKIIEKWKRIPLYWDMILFDFEETVIHLVIAMKVLYENNKEILRDYGS